MKVCVIGGKGSIGSRYVAILKYLGHEPIVWDLPEAESQDLPEAEKYIIATPTDTHYEWCKKLIAKNATFLCEKPLSKNLKECEELALYRNGYVVNNYAFVVECMIVPKPPLKIKYDYYRTGNDGLYWDCCQIINIDPTADLKNISPILNISFYGELVPYRWIEASYIAMIAIFVNDKSVYRHRLWSLMDGLNMTKAVLDRMERDKCADISL